MKRLLSCILLALSVLAHAADLKMHTARVAKSGTQIYVQFETPVALTDCDILYNPPSATTIPPGCTLSGNPWTVAVYDATGHLIPGYQVLSAVDPIGHLPANGLVTLTLDRAVPQDAIRVDVTFGRQNIPHISTEAKRTKLIRAPAPTKESATVYLSGTFSPAVGATPEYTTDSKVNQPLKYFGSNQSSQISALATVQTDSKGKADPDGFSWGLPLKHVFPKPYSLQWSPVGMELDKRANAINFVSAPSATGSWGRAFFGTDTKHGGVKAVTASVGLDITLGVEFGANLRDKFTIANNPTATEGAFFRGVPSTTAYLVIPRWRAFNLTEITLSSSYTARIPTSNELFLETRNTSTPIPRLTSQTRNWVQNDLKFKLASYLAIEIKHQYGSIPPAFNFVQNSGSIGLIYSFQEKNGESTPK